MYPESDIDLNRETDDAVYFFTPAFHPLDNFSAHSIHIWGIDFPTAEHAFQWKKFSTFNPDIAKRIATAKSPHAVKEISEANKSEVTKDWFDIRASVMEEILRSKVSQHEDVKEILLKTGSRGIIENSPVDSYWGIGIGGSGQNMLGKIWMKIRETL